MTTKSEEERILDETSGVGASQVNDQMHVSKHVEIPVNAKPAEGTETRDMVDVALHGDIPYDPRRVNHKGEALLREKLGHAAVDARNPLFTKHGWNFFPTWMPDEGSGGQDYGLVVRHQKSTRRESAVLEFNDLPMITEGTEYAKRKFHAFVDFCLERSGFDPDDCGQERMRCFNALQAVPDEMVKAYLSTPYGKINNVSFVPTNVAMESLNLHDT